MTSQILNCITSYVPAIFKQNELARESKDPHSISVIAKRIMDLGLAYNTPQITLLGWLIGITFKEDVKKTIEGIQKLFKLKITAGEGVATGVALVFFGPQFFITLCLYRALKTGVEIRTALDKRIADEEAKQISAQASSQKSS